MFEAGTAAGTIQPYFLTQAVPDLDGSVPLAQQQELPAIEGQALDVAQVLASFIGEATAVLDIAIYDFRLLDGALTQRLVDAVTAAVQRNVAVRIAYDRAQEAADATALKAFADAGGDPAPTGTHTFLGEAGFPAEVQLQPVREEAIDPGHQIMHQKYMVRDPGTANAAVLMGSANFTTDAWGIQDNNMVIVTGSQELAAAYEQDFTDLWTTARLAGTGAGDTRTVTVAGTGVTCSFAPGDGTLTENAIASLIAGATSRIRLASMVISSGKILQALASRIEAGIDVAGIYDRPEMNNVASEWQRFAAQGGPAAQHLALWNSVAPSFVGKASLPFTAEGPHNFMHNKAVVADGTVATGSFNFSNNATRNAENVLRIVSDDLAAQYATYIDGLVQRYRG